MQYPRRVLPTLGLDLELSLVITQPFEIHLKYHYLPESTPNCAPASGCLQPVQARRRHQEPALAAAAPAAQAEDALCPRRQGGHGHRAGLALCPERTAMMKELCGSCVGVYGPTRRNFVLLGALIWL